MSLSTARDTNVNSVETFLGGQCAVLLSMFDLIALIRSSHWSATEVRAPHTRCMNRAAQHHAHANGSDAIEHCDSGHREATSCLHLSGAGADAPS